MTVKELIADLQQEDGDRLVVMASDGEGNKYSPLSAYDTGAYTPESTWSGEVGLEKLTPELEKQGYSEEDVAEDGVPALILYPVN